MHPAAPGPLVPPQPERRRTTDSATTTAPGLALSTPAAGGVTIAELSGELDIAGAPALREQLLGLLRSGSSRLVIDLSKVSHCDASGLAVLIGTGRRARLLGGFLRLAAVSPQVDQRAAHHRTAPPSRRLPHRPGRDSQPAESRATTDSATAVYSIHSPGRLEDGPETG